MNKQFLVVEKIYDGFAYCEDENRDIIKISMDNMPENLKENDCIILIEDKYIIDEKLTEERKQSIINLSKSLFD